MMSLAASGPPLTPERVPPLGAGIIYDGHAVSSSHNKLNGCRVLIGEEETFCERSDAQISRREYLPRMPLLGQTAKYSLRANDVRRCPE